MAEKKTTSKYYERIIKEVREARNNAIRNYDIDAPSIIQFMVQEPITKGENGSDLKVAQAAKALSYMGVPVGRPQE